MTVYTGPGLANLAAALAKVQAQLPKLERDRTVEITQKNGQAYSYSYVTLANLSDAVLPLLAKHGLCFAALPGTGGDGKMALLYYLIHESGEALAGEFPISGEGGIQMIGGRISYGRRYCLAAIVGAAADDDDEARLSDEGTKGTAQRAPQRPRQPRNDPEPAQGGTAQRSPQRPRGAAPPLPGDEPSDAMTEPQKRALMAAYQGRSRDDRIAHAVAIVGRELESFTGPDGLSKSEAGALLDALAPPDDDGEVPA